MRTKRRVMSDCRTTSGIDGIGPLLLEVLLDIRDVLYTLQETLSAEPPPEDNDGA